VQPLTADIQTDLTAYEVFSLFSGAQRVAFLESRPGYGALSQYSILGVNPYLSLRGRPGECLLDGSPAGADALAILARLLAAEANESIAGLPLSGGCIGYLAYDAGFPLVELPLPERARQAAGDWPLVGFDFFDNYLIFDHTNESVTALACGRLKPAAESLADLAGRLAAGGSTCGQMAEQAHEPCRSLRASCPVPILSPIIAEAEYITRVEAIRTLIRQGEVYIANLTQQLSGTSGEPADWLYDRLRRINPAPFAAFVRQDNLEILSASPERFLRIRPGAEPPLAAVAGWRRRFVETRPIKGTRPRGRNPEEDEANARELLASEKDRSELLMIVDLERNDLSRICKPESVAVPELFRLETFPGVFHLVATVQGELRPEIDAVDALQACFPGGSITGAPKVAAMQVIDRLEDQARGLYTGCLGYLSFDGQADFSILIRTMIRCGNRIRYGSGGGITWESDPPSEYQEMLVKAGSFLHIMGREVADGDPDSQPNAP
jgi:para-aminobenzoate synthetase component I